MSDGGLNPELQKNIISRPIPEDIGFKQMSGTDVLEATSLSPKDTLQRLASMRIDHTENRKKRWSNAIDSIHNIGGIEEKRRQALNKLNTLLKSNTVQDNPDLTTAVTYSRDVFANYTDKTNLRMVIHRGGMDTTQDSIARIKSLVSLHLSETDPQLLKAIDSTIILANEKYAQDHDGEAYQTAEQKQQMKELKARQKNIKVT